MKRGERAQLWRANDGAGAIEFAFVAGILAVMLLGVLDFGIGFWEKMEVNNAAQAGADFAVKKGYDSANIEIAITNATGLGAIQASPAPSQGCGCPNATTGVTTQVCGVACSNGDMPGTYVTVNAQVSYHTIFSWPGLPNPVTLASSATVRIN